ncbi:F-box/kelch-repeat protein SKIP30 [Tanacetum coccineum]
MSILIEGLPNDIAIRCLARVPYYLFPKLETVSHSWWAAVHSTEFYKARQAVNSTESLLCVCAVDPENIWQLYDPNRDIWLTLPVLPSEVRNLAQFGVASVSGKLFVLGGRSHPVSCVQDRTSTNEVWAYDPIFRQWAQRAPMIVPRASFACCVWNGKILVAGGFTAPMKSTSTAEIYDPDTDTWDPIPDLDHGHDSQCKGFVIDGAIHVVSMVLNEVQVLENLNDKWQRSRSLNEGLITVVNGSLYGMTYHYREIYNEERGGICKFVVSASQFDDRTGFAMMGFRDDIYVIGGVVCPGGWNRGRAKKLSDVDVLVLGNENEKPVWKKVASMTRCQGVILGSAELRI